MKNLQGVTIKSGFWKGHEGLVVGKIPFLPIYRVVVGYQIGRHVTDYSYLFSNLPDGHWLPFFQLGEHPINDEYSWPRKLEIKKQCILYLVKHCSGALIMNSPDVVSAMDNTGRATGYQGLINIPMNEPEAK